MSALRTDKEEFAGMISINEKSYVLLQKNGKLKIHGSALKGKQMPIVCDKFRDALCFAVLYNTSTVEVFKQFRSLKGFKLTDFQVRIYPSKSEYGERSLYNKLIQQLAANGIKTVLGGSLEYVKVKGGHRPVLLFGGDDQIDYIFYKKKLCEIASLILNQPAKSLYPLFAEGQSCLV
jgi:hypothetical protein